jgi:hypothetical protein
MVHWVSHPPEQGHRLTAWLALDEGLIEGLTQVVTEDIFEDRGISQYWKAIYMEQVAIVRKLIERFGVQPFGELLFRGHPRALRPLLDTYGGQGMQQIKTLAKANNSKKAVEMHRQSKPRLRRQAKKRGRFSRNCRMLLALVAMIASITSLPPSLMTAITIASLCTSIPIY